MSDTRFVDPKVGDKVIFHYSGWGDMLELATITKVGKFININIRGKTNFRLSGSSVGYRDGRISPYSEQEWGAYVQKLEDDKKRRQCEDFNWRQCSPEKVRTVHAILFAEQNHD